MKNYMTTVITNRWSRAVALGTLLATLLLALLVAPSIAGTTTATTNAGSATVDPATAPFEWRPDCPPDDDELYEWLLDVLRLVWLLLEAEGEESDITDANQGMTLVGGAYVEHGFLPGLTSQQRADGIEALEDIEEALEQDLIVCVNAQVRDDFLELIPDMIDDLD
jgi:hypothetical protein